MSQFDSLTTVNTNIDQRVRADLEQCFEKCLTEEKDRMHEALLAAGWKAEDLSETDMQASILAQFIEGLYKAEEYFVAKLADLGYDA